MSQVEEGYYVRTIRRTAPPLLSLVRPVNILFRLRAGEAGAPPAGRVAAIITSRPLMVDIETEISSFCELLEERPRIG